MFTDFIWETGAFLFLLDREHNPISPYTFERTSAAVDGDGYPFRFSNWDEDYILTAQYNNIRSDEFKHAVLGSIPFVAVTAVILCFIGA